jgi:rubredoxin
MDYYSAIRAFRYAAELGSFGKAAEDRGEAPTHFDGASVTSSASDGSSDSTGSAHAEIAPRFPDPVILIPARTPFKKWICERCGWIYDEEAGSPEDGIPPETRWADVPGDWRCPLCGAGKDEFEMVEFETLGY